MQGNGRGKKGIIKISAWLFWNLFIFFFPAGTGDWTQGFVHYMQALYHWSSVPSLLWLLCIPQRWHMYLSLTFLWPKQIKCSCPNSKGYRNAIILCACLGLTFGYFCVSLRLSIWVLVAHTCNPSYSGGRDQEDCGSRLAQAESESLSQKYTIHTQKRAGEVAHVV
jgi:hypothetical protein